MGEKTIVSDQEAAAVQKAVYEARNSAKTINTEDEADMALRDRVLDACDAAESFLDSTHPQGAERDMRDLQSALDGIGEAFETRQIEGDDLSYLRAPFESLEARLGRIWRRMEQTPAGRAAVEEAQEPEFAETPSNPATEERTAVVAQSGEVINNVNISLVHINELKLPDGLSDAAKAAAAKVPGLLTFLRDTLLDEKYRAGLLRLQAALKNLRRGALGLSILGLQEVLGAIRDTVRKIEDAAPILTAQAKASLEHAIEQGRALLEAAERLRDRAYAAADGIDLTPWPTGLRLLPPPTPEDAPEDVELVEVQRFEGRDDYIYGLAPLSTTRFVSGGSDEKLYVWEVGQDAPLQAMEGHRAGILRIAALDGRHVVSASNDDSLILWDTETGALVQRFEGHGDAVADVAALSPDRFISEAWDKTARLWHRDQGEALTVWGQSNRIRAVAALSAHTVVTGDRGGALFLRHVDHPDPVWHHEGEDAKTWKLAARDAASFFSVKPGSHQIYEWSQHSPTPIAHYDAIGSNCHDLTLLSDNRLLSAHDSGLGCWSASAGRGGARLLARAATPKRLLSVRALPSPDPHIGRLIVGGANGYLAYWEVRPK